MTEKEDLNGDMPRIIAVDFDGTIVQNKWPEIGEINKHVVEEMRREDEDGTVIILWTCRTGKELEEAIKFCYENDIPIDYANENCEWVKNHFDGEGIKVFAFEYWDDKALNVDDIPVAVPLDIGENE